MSIESHGNALGIGWADYPTHRLVDSIDQQAMFMNCVTANAPDVGKIRFALANDRVATGNPLAWRACTARCTSASCMFRSR